MTAVFKQEGFLVSVLSELVFVWLILALGIMVIYHLLWAFVLVLLRHAASTSL